MSSDSFEAEPDHYASDEYASQDYHNRGGSSPAPATSSYGGRRDNRPLYASRPMNMGRSGAVMPPLGEPLARHNPPQSPQGDMGRVRTRFGRLE